MFAIHSSGENGTEGRFGNDGGLFSSSDFVIGLLKAVLLSSFLFAVVFGIFIFPYKCILSYGCSLAPCAPDACLCRFTVWLALAALRRLSSPTS